MVKTIKNSNEFRSNTPLRRLHQNGDIPYRETRSNVACKVILFFVFFFW